jgi:hypothetical protein
VRGRWPCHPLKAVRKHCLWCCNGSFAEVKLCAAKSCPLWPFRHGHRPPDSRGAAFLGTSLRAIRRRCIDCSGNEWKATAAERLALARAAAPKKPIETPHLLNDQCSARGGVLLGASLEEAGRPTGLARQT